MKAIVAFSYAQRRLEDEPNPCNEKLAFEVERLFNENEETIIIAQWEIARKLRVDGFPVCRVVELQNDGSYLDSEGVWREARIFCKLNEI